MSFAIQFRTKSRCALSEIRFVLGSSKKIIDTGNGDAVMAVVALSLTVGLDFGGSASEYRWEYPAFGRHHHKRAKELLVTGGSTKTEQFQLQD